EVEPVLIPRPTDYEVVSVLGAADKRARRHVAAAGADRVSLGQPEHVEAPQKLLVPAPADTAPAVARLAGMLATLPPATAKGGRLEAPTSELFPAAVGGCELTRSRSPIV